MKKLALILAALCILNPAKCNKDGNKSSSNNSSTAEQWSSWTSISSFPLKARFRRLDDLGAGNYAWQVLIRNDDLVSLRFTYRIVMKKGDGTTDVTEDTIDLSPGTPTAIRVGGASIVRVSASDVKKTL